jgi:simple sugar transport system substrate-binding protein
LPTDKVKVIISGNTPDRAERAIREELASDPTIDMLIGTGQSDTLGAGLAVSKIRGHRTPYVAGFDISEAILALIKSGTIDFTIDQQPYVQGFYPLIQLHQNALYGIVPSDVDAGSAVIDRGNVDLVIAAAHAGYR